ncbi:MAG: PilZ domain-containing protein [Sphingomonadales bacterium]
MTLSLANNIYAKAAQEDRSAPRIRLDLPAMLRPSGAHSFPTKIIDLSLGGFAAQAVTGMHAGTICWLSIGPLKGLQAEVVWNDGQTVGCAFATMLNPAVFESVLGMKTA